MRKACSRCMYQFRVGNGSKGWKEKWISVRVDWEGQSTRPKNVISMARVRRYRASMAAIGW